MLPKLMDAITSEYTTAEILESLHAVLTKRLDNSNGPLAKLRVYKQCKLIEAAIEALEAESKPNA